MGLGEIKFFAAVKMQKDLLIGIVNWWEVRRDWNDEISPSIDIFLPSISPPKTIRTYWRRIRFKEEVHDIDCVIEYCEQNISTRQVRVKHSVIFRNNGDVDYKEGNGMWVLADPETNEYEVASFICRRP